MSAHRNEKSRMNCVRSRINTRYRPAKSGALHIALHIDAASAVPMG
jgi:hypothetical protein